MEPFSQPTPPRAPSPLNTVLLPAEINAATRKAHTELNRLIIDRLPLALPPQADSPATYGRGLVVFAQLYFVFEQSWQQLEDALAAEKSGQTAHLSEVLSWLAKLRPSGLPRSARLRDDLLHLKAVEQPFALGETWKRQLQDDLQTKPHTLVAYAWVMYMAIFSGGRWIRQELENAGPEFWAGKCAAVDADQNQVETLGRSFLCFEGEQDGEDIKATFKAGLAEGETLLTTEERRDIVDAAQGLFDRCIGMVKFLDSDPASTKLTADKTTRNVIIGVGAILCAFGFYTVRAMMG